ncbi:hypothetical protein QTP86_023807, partial [Hemibagrus guttatus]
MLDEKAALGEVRSTGGNGQFCGVVRTKSPATQGHKDERASDFSDHGLLGSEMDIVDNYKYLGVHIDNKLDWTKNTDALYKKGQDSPVLPQEIQ